MSINYNNLVELVNNNLVVECGYDEDGLVFNEDVNYLVSGGSEDSILNEYNVGGGNSVVFESDSVDSSIISISEWYNSSDDIEKFNSNMNKVREIVKGREIVKILKVSIEYDGSFIVFYK